MYIFKLYNINVKYYNNYLEEAVGLGIVKRREQGKNVYYSLAGEYAEEKILEEWLRQAREKLNFLPEEFESYV